MNLRPFPFRPGLDVAEAIARAARVCPLDNLPPTARGNTVDIAPCQTETILRARNSSEQGEGICVTLALTTDDRLAADEGPSDVLAFPRIRALLQWGAGNAIVDAECDFMSGAVLSLNCETLTVSVAYDVVTPPWYSERERHRAMRCCSPSFRATALLGYGGGQGAQLTELAQIEEPDGSTLVAIPQFAQSFSVMPCEGSRVSVDILPCGRGYRVPEVIVAPLSNNNQNNSISSTPLFGGARHLEVTSRNQAGPAFAFVVFDLAF
jgi:hypothetical protein